MQYVIAMVGGFLRGLADKGSHRITRNLKNATHFSEEELAEIVAKWVARTGRQAEVKEVASEGVHQVDR